MISIRYTATEAADLRDRIRRALDHPDTEEGMAAASVLRSLANEIDSAIAGVVPAPAPVMPHDCLELN